MMQHRRLATPVALAAALFLAGIAGARAQPTNSPATNGPAATTPPRGNGVPVGVAPVSRADVPVILRNVGLVQAFQSVLVRARVDGTLQTVDFTEGQNVKPGDLLAVIDPRPYQAALDQALAKKRADEAQLVNARLDLARYSELAKSQFATRQSVDTQLATVAQFVANIEGDTAAIDTAQLNLSFTRVTSPIEGRAGLRMIDVGNLIHASDSAGIVTITQIHPIALIFTLPQDTLPQVIEAMHGGTLVVTAFASDDHTELAHGTLLTVDNTIDQTTGTYKLKAVFSNLDEKLWPGQFVNARLFVRTLPGALTVPSTALQRGPRGVFVYAVNADQTVAVTAVEVVQDDGQTAVIGRGVTADMKVVVNGQSKLQNGTRVAATIAGAGG
jgi:multidrug efflux system membrane fusion protein